MWVKVHKLFFEVEGKEAPAGYRVRLPDDTFDHAPVEIDGIAMKTVSPLALYQLRIGIASQGSFGELPETQQRAAGRLRQEFFPAQAERDLATVIEPLA